MRSDLALVGASALIVVGALVACSSDSSAPSSQPQPTSTPPAPPPPPPATQREGGLYSPFDDDAGSNACVPAAQPGELYALSSMDLAGVNEVSMCRYRGKVALVVNTASQCGYTPEYGPLQTIYEKYKAQGFVVLGFPSGSFNQELDSGVAVSEFCTKTYGITFPMFAISNVNPPNENPIYTWLKAQPGSGAGGAYSAAIPWNFEKWLVSRKGVVVNRFNYTVYPDTTDVTTAVEAELSK